MTTGGGAGDGGREGEMDAVCIQLSVCRGPCEVSVKYVEPGQAAQKHTDYEARRRCRHKGIHEPFTLAIKEYTHTQRTNLSSSPCHPLSTDPRHPPAPTPSTYC